MLELKREDNSKQWNSIWHQKKEERALFFLTAEYYSTAWIYRLVSVHPSIGGHLGSCHLLAIVKSAALKRGGQLGAYKWVVRNGHSLLLEG